MRTQGVGVEDYEFDQPLATLDLTELELLICMVRGMSQLEIRLQFGLSQLAYDHRVMSLMQKINAKTNADAVRIGLLAGLGHSS